MMRDVNRMTQTCTGNSEKFMVSISTLPRDCSIPNLLASAEFGLKILNRVSEMAKC